MKTNVLDVIKRTWWKSEGQPNPVVSLFESAADLRRERRRELFWEIVHNVQALLVFLVCLPVLPIIRVIQAIRGEYVD